MSINKDRFYDQEHVDRLQNDKDHLEMQCVSLRAILENQTKSLEFHRIFYGLISIVVLVLAGALLWR